MVFGKEYNLFRAMIRLIFMMAYRFGVALKKRKNSTRFFFKRVLALPRRTPKYIQNSGMGLEPAV